MILPSHVHGHAVLAELLENAHAVLAELLENAFVEDVTVKGVALIGSKHTHYSQFVMMLLLLKLTIVENSDITEYKTYKHPTSNILKGDV